jgi:hypothetical protein
MHEARMGKASRSLLARASIVACLALVLYGLWVVAFVVGGHVVAPEARVEAVRLLSVPIPPVRGRDGSDDWWTLGYDVPRGERASVAAAHRAHVYAREDLDLEGRDQEASRLVDPLSRFPRLPSYGSGRWQCDPNATGCLRHIRENRALVGRVLSEHAATIQRGLEFSGFDGVRIGRIPRDKADQPRMIPGRRLVYTALAARFAGGEQQPGIAATCRDLAGWRRIGADNDFMPMGAMAARYVRQDLVLLAEMLLELPAGFSLPPGCASALAPASDAELSICPALRSEFNDFRASFPGAHPEDLLDLDELASIRAPRFARYCEPRMLAAARADRSVRQVPQATVGCGLKEWLADYRGCMRATADDPRFVEGYDAYADWRTDQAASIALMRTWLWLRRQSDNPHDWWPLLKRLPPSFGLRRKPAMGSGKLVIELLDTSRFQFFRLPLPGQPVCREDARTNEPCGPR